MLYSISICSNLLLSPSVLNSFSSLTTHPFISLSSSKHCLFLLLHFPFFYFTLSLHLSLLLTHPPSFSLYFSVSLSFTLVPSLPPPGSSFFLSYSFFLSFLSLLSFSLTSVCIIPRTPLSFIWWIYCNCNKFSRLPAFHCSHSVLRCCCVSFDCGPKASPAVYKTPFRPHYMRMQFCRITKSHYYASKDYS